MKTFFKITLSIILIVANSCQKDDAQLGGIEAPTDLQIQVNVEDGQTGNVTITPSAQNAINYQVFFSPDRDPEVVGAGGSATFRYTQSGQYSVLITVAAFGVGGVSTSRTVSVDLDVRLFIDQETLQILGGDGSKRWVWDSSTPGHLGVGPITNDFPEFFSADPDELNPCLYDDVLVFNYDANDNYTFELITGDTSESFINWAEVTQFFPDATPDQFVDECRDITDQISTNTTYVIFENDEGKRILLLDNSVMSYWAGVEEYEIVELTADKLSLRGIQEVPSESGGGELAWYHIFVPEPSSSGNIEPPFDNLMWSDEFDTDGALDASKWTYDLGDGCPDLCGWGNGEAQSYTDLPANVTIESGVLKINAVENGGGYTSARVKTQGLFDFTYGRVEISAKLPDGGGTWPALWLLGSNITSVGWPACGEMDIMEHVGNNLDDVSSALHFPGNSAGDAIVQHTTVTNATTAFHTYEVEWSSDQIVFSVDGTAYHTFNYTTDSPFYDNPFFLIMNIAMGGTLGGTIDPAFTSSTMEIDYVRVYQ